MAVVTRPCGVYPCVSDCACRTRSPKYGWTAKSTGKFIKTQICTIAISLSLFNSVRLPREAFKYGAVYYLVVYSFWLLVVSLPATLLQLAMGQLSQQDAVGVWRAVPILRGVGHLKLLTSFICCVYNTIIIALSLAYLIWIAKGTFPLRDCTRLHLTPNGYENKMNASECFNSTFLASFAEFPQYLGIMSIIIFVLWFFVPMLIYRLRKSLRVTFIILAPVIVAIAIVLCIFLADSSSLDSLLESCHQWNTLSEPYIWQSSLVQALISTHAFGGYLVSAGGSIYRNSDVRWSTTSLLITNLLSGWAWVLLWQSLGGSGTKDSSLISVLVLIYQSSIAEQRKKEWPLLAFGVVFLSGIITVLTLLFPIYDKLHRLTGDHWKLFAAAASAIGTALSVTVLSRGLEIATMMDELVIPVLAVFTTAIEIVGFTFIYGWCFLNIDIEFLTGSRLPCIWSAGWWTTPFILVGVLGWWLRSLIKATWGEVQTLWPLVAVFIGILIIMVVIAGVAVAKEEQFNLFLKITSAFRPSRLWGPEEPMARYVWMSQRYAHELASNSETRFPEILEAKQKDRVHYNNWAKNDNYDVNLNVYRKGVSLNDDVFFKSKDDLNVGSFAAPVLKNKETDEKYRSPNICIANGEVNSHVGCNCNRHFTLNVPNLRRNDVTTSL